MDIHTIDRISVIFLCTPTWLNWSVDPIWTWWWIIFVCFCIPILQTLLNISFKIYPFICFLKKTTFNSNIPNFCPQVLLAGQWSSHIFTHDRYNILSDILTEFEVNLGIIIEKYAKIWSFPHVLIVYGDMHFKDLLGSIIRIGYRIQVPDFYLMLHGFRCQKSTIMD